MKRQQTRLKHFVVMRFPVLMEDEGHGFFVRVFTDKLKAESWVATQKDAYFKPSDYYILEESR